MPHLNDLPPLSLGGLLPARDGHVEANLAEGICVGAPGDRPYAFGAESLRSLKQVFHPFTPPTQSLVEALTYWSQQQPDEVAYYYLVDGEQEEFAITYQQLERRAQEIAGKLQSMGMAGQRALLLYPPGPDFVMGFFGCLYAGMTAVPAYPPRRNRNMGRIQAIADDAGAKVALTVSDVLERTQGLLDETPKLKQLHWISTDQINGESLCHWREPVIEHDDIAFLQYTSGSTGTPKGVMISHGNMMHNLAIISQGFEYFREGKGMTWLPTYHDMGLVGGVLAPIYYGRPNIVMSPMSFLQKPLRWLQAIDKYRVAVSGGPNFAYDLCVQKIAPEQTKGLDLSCWVVAFNGAEPVRPQTIKKFSEAFASCGFKPEAFYPCYGMAETTLIVTGGARAAKPVFKAFDGEALGDHRVVPADPNDASARLLVGCGQALPQTELIIVDPQTRTRLAEGEVGEIWIASPSVGKGYLHKNELTEEVFRARLANNGQGPYLRTGDLGFLADGEVFVTGRLKDLIIIRGVNRYPQDIESTVERASDRLQPGASAAIAVDVAGRERLIVIAEVARKRQRDGWNEVIDAIRRDVTLEHDVPPDAVILVRAGSIPKTSSGKIQRHACRDGFIEGSLSGVAQWCSWVEEREEETPSAAEVVEDARRKGLLSAEQLEAVDPKVVEIVVEHIRGIAKERAKDLTVDTSVVALGLDSLERMEIAASLEETFGGRFPEDVLPEIETPREVAAAIEKYIGREPVQREQRADADDIPEKDYRFDKMPEYVQLMQIKNLLRLSGAPNPFFQVHEGIAADTTVVEGRELVNFSSFNYIGMSEDPVVCAAAKEAIDRFGASTSASRLVSGEKTIHRDLERELAEFHRVDDAIIFATGHATNESVIGHLFGPGDLIVHDGLAHNSIIQGAIQSGARRRPFTHNDHEALDKLLTEIRSDYRRVLVAIEGVYSMDGDFADLPKFIEVKRRHKALLLLDEAHSVGTMGATGGGLGEHFNVADRAEVDLWMGTLSKALGSLGGYIAGCKELVEYLRYTTPAIVFTTGPAPATVAAALAALRLLRQEPQRVAKCQANSRLFLGLAKQRGLNTGTSEGTPVVPIIVGNSHHALIASGRMADQGVNVQPILHPAVEEKAARLRFFISSAHSEQQIRDTVEKLAAVMGEIDPAYLANA